MKLPARKLLSDQLSESQATSAESEISKARRLALRQIRRARKPKPAKLIAYDFETTRIQAGTPRPLYITAYGELTPMHYASRIDDMDHLTLILRANFLTEDHKGIKYIAWNGNNFDAYFVAAALVREEDLVLRPYLTRSGSLRGLRVMLREDADNPRAVGWEFLDGIAMLGLVGTNLDKFTENFAPNYRKMTGVIDFEKEEFDCDNALHCEYAMVDSIGLYHGMTRAQDILMEEFDQPLAVTMGGACIKIFKAHIPSDVIVSPLDDKLMDITRDYVMRGGFCYCVKRYHGPVWKYDINQAYAAAMRDAKLPSGRPMHTENGLHKYAQVFIARVTAQHASNIIPFYYRTEQNGRLKSAFSRDRIDGTWITSIEFNQLKAEGWTIKVHESYTWEDSFSMRDYVDKLERIRTTCEGGPSGPIGTMAKAVGNHSYGKTVEQLEPIEFILADEAPPGWMPYYGNESEPLDHVYYRWIEDEDVRPKDYHQPHIGAFITAHVRMVLRRAALVAPSEWLYADTDCVVFSRDVTADLDVDAKRYGAWKIEKSGAEFKIIAKKVYTEIVAPGTLDEKGKPKKPQRSAKGMNIKRLSDDDFDHWFEGNAPVQHQVQRNNFIKVMRGAEMYRKQERTGTRIEARV